MIFKVFSLCLSSVYINQVVDIIIFAFSIVIGNKTFQTVHFQIMASDIKSAHSTILLVYYAC